MRKRPIFPHELQAGEFDVVTCCGATGVTVHDARMSPNMVGLFMDNHEFLFDRVFDECASNEEVLTLMEVGSSSLTKLPLCRQVYRETTQPLLQRCLEAKLATCLVYGQTGSGKTFTMSSIYEQAARDLFAQGRLPEDAEVSATFMELNGVTAHMTSRHQSTNL